MEQNKYHKACIYLIKCNKTNLGYVGSTIQGMKLRLSKHETDYKGYMGLLKCHRNYRGSFDILCNEDYCIHLLEQYKCEDKKELEKRETQWIFKCSAIMEMTNKNMPSKLVAQDINIIKDFIIPESVMEICIKQDWEHYPLEDF